MQKDIELNLYPVTEQYEIPQRRIKAKENAESCLFTIKSTLDLANLVYWARHRASFEVDVEGNATVHVPGKEYKDHTLHKAPLKARKEWRKK